MRRLLFAALLFLSADAFANADLSVKVGRTEEGVPFFGRPYTFTLTVKNDGPQVAHDVVAMWYFVEEPLPPIPDPRCTVAQSNAFRCAFGGMAAGESVQLAASLVVRGSAATAYTVWAEVTSSVADPVDVNNRDFLHLYPVTVLSDLGLQITMPSRINADGRATIRYSIKNQSRWPADLRINIALPYAVELVTANANCARSSEPGLFAQCALPILAPGETFHLDLTVRFPTGDGHIETAMTPVWNAIATPGATIRELQTYPRTYVVTSAADSGAGTLRQAILDANAGCAPQSLPCTIALELPLPIPASGWYTIRPLTPLPEITTPGLTIDAETQTHITGDSNPAGPEVELDGSALTGGNGFFVRAAGTVIRGFAIGNFPDNGIFLLRQNAQTPVSATVERNFIGIAPNGATAPNGRAVMAPHGALDVHDSTIAANRRSGIYAWDASVFVTGNRIERNGASGIYIGPRGTANLMRNVITSNREFGVAIARDMTTRVSLSGNRIAANGHGGVDIGLDGPTLEGPGPVPPVITAAYYDGQITYIQGFLPPEKTGQTHERYTVELFANSEVDEHGLAEGEQILLAGNTPVGPDGRFSVAIQADLRGKYVNGIGTRITTLFGEYTFYESSEFGKGRRVE